MTVQAQNAGLHRLHPSELHESPVNPRSISPERFEALKYALDADPSMLEARPIIATLDGEVVCGNMRLRAIRDLGWSTVPVFLADLSAERKREWMLRDNQEYGDWERDAVATLVQEHANAGADMQLLGFMQQELDVLLTSVASGGAEPPISNDDPPDIWGVVVECDSEDQQAELLERLDSEGFTVRALL
jgi:ParB-like chromosome segregation protein Spo0J